MVNPFKKKEKKETFANGRIIVTDFKNLKKEDFPQCERADMFFLDYDGRICIDSGNEANAAIISILKIISQYPQAELRKWEKKQKRKYTDVRTVEDLARFEKDNVGFMNVLTLFLIPLECKSRQLRRRYYGIF